MLDGFGKNDPRKMPRHLFWQALHLDYASAIRADVTKQNCSICPRHWYISAAFRCGRCGETFVFTNLDQKRWYEDFGFWIDSVPTNCGKCRLVQRDQKALQQEYDRDVAAALRGDAGVERKERLLKVIALLESAGVKLPEAVYENRRILTKRVARIRRPSDSNVSDP